MPLATIKITKEGGPKGEGPSKEQKALLIQGVTDLLVEVLDKDPATTFVIIDEISLDDWGIGGLSTREYRKSKT